MIDHNARMAALTLQILGDATLNLKGKDVAAYVDVHNWLEQMRTAPERAEQAAPECAEQAVQEQAANSEGETDADPYLNQQAAQG